MSEQNCGEEERGAKPSQQKRSAPQREEAHDSELKRRLSHSHKHIASAKKTEVLGVPPSSSTGPNTHFHEQRGLGAIEVVDASAVRNEAIVFEFVHKILKRRVGDIKQLGLD